MPDYCESFFEDRAKLIFSGYAAVWDMPDETGEIFRRGAFTKTLTSKQPKMLYEHDEREIVGEWLEIIEDDYGLFVRGRIFPESGRGPHAVTVIENGALDSLSVGFIAIDEIMENGRRVIIEADLWEVSLVAFPAQSAARLNCATTDAIAFFEATAMLFA